MADAETAERKPRKSVAFAEGQTIVDGNGDVTETNGHDGEKNSAESHSKEETDDVAALMEGLSMKKKKKKVKKDDAAEEGGDDKPADDGEVDLAALKKKKKKKPKAPEDDFEAKLAEAGATGEDAEKGEDDADKGDDENALQDGDLIKGTGIWAHDATAEVNYTSLLHRFFTLLHDSHPDLASSGGKSYKIPPPQCLREGNKKTIFANIAEICKRMKRTDEHVTQFLFAELGTSGSVDGSRRLVIKGRFQQKQIENVLRRYIGKPSSILPCS
jgi:translation initiation factor 2 subunit 2